MRTSIFRSVYLLFFFFIPISHGLSSINTTIPNCPIFNCGDGVNISYPFWVSAQTAAASKSFCGYPEFKVTCNGTKPSFQTISDNYTVKSIDPTNRILSLVDTAVVGKDCPRVRNNVSFSDSLTNNYTVAISAEYLVFLFGCNLSLYKGPKVPQEFEITCPLNESGTSYVFFPVKNPYLPVEYTGLYAACKGGSVVSPVRGGSLGTGDPGTAFGRALSGGFEVRWEGPAMEDCRKCERNGGRCGYNNQTGNGWVFQCFCRKGVHYDGDCGSGNNSKKALTIGLGIGSAVVVLILSAFLLLYFGKCCTEILPNSTRKAEDKTVEEFLMRDQLFAVKRYKFSELKQITASFSETLGRGGFATVYKGKLQDGTPVAVKLLKDSQDTGEEFINEVASIGRTNHVNVVRLLGFCSDTPRRRALVYEFMPNGSLEKFLFNVNVGAPTPAPAVALDWEKLHGIAVGIARGLEYLHRGCNTRIVHLDIKPHNILLDDNMQPKISDFGLARLCKPMESVLSSAIGVRGTIGYIAPEVFSRTFGSVSGKSDVYSYGMMLLEMAGRRRNVRADARNSSEVYFPHWIYEHLDEYYGLEACENSRECEIARKMVLVGLWCIQMDPSARPSIIRVVEMLETAGVEELEMPPKPYMCSPDRSGRDLVAIDSSSTFETSGSRSS